MDEMAIVLYMVVMGKAILRPRWYIDKYRFYGHVSYTLTERKDIVESIRDVSSLSFAEPEIPTKSTVPRTNI